MKPVIAIVGRPNVGKSTLFNHLTNSRDALIADMPGVTRDRQYAYADYQGFKFILVDTGGLEEYENISPEISRLVTRQSMQAASEADAVIWLVDARDGLSMMDEKLAMMLRPVCKNLYLAVNKSEGLDESAATAEFHQLGIANVQAISAKRGSGLPALLDNIRNSLPVTDTTDEPDEDIPKHLRITIIGRPNVGKSTLVNRILGEERVLTWDQPGTTRDTIHIPFTRDGNEYELVDTAGVRRRSRVTDQVEKISIIKTLEAMEQSDVIILVVDAHEQISDQDATLLGLAVDSYKALVIAINKWDGLESSERDLIKRQFDRKLGFIDYACIHCISALHGTGVGDIFKSIKKISRSVKVAPKPARLTEILNTATQQHAPPLIQGRRVKLRYAHLGGHSPLRIIIHGNQVKKLGDDYRRYLGSFYRNSLRLTGTPVLIEFRQGENPYQGKKNVLSERQKSRRKRMIRHSRKKSGKR